VTDKTNNDKEQVQPKPTQQSDEEIRSYWTPERLKEAKPIPLPEIKPPKGAKKGSKPPPRGAQEVVSEPMGPDPKRTGP